MTTTELTLGTFPDAVRAGGILLVDFWAAWCGPCRAFAPIFDQAARNHTDIVFGTVDTEAEQQLAALHRVTSIPTIIIFRDGIQVFSRPGVISGADLEQLIQHVRDLDMDAVRAELGATDG